MGAANFILILVAEVLAVSLFVTVVVLWKNRRLRRLVSKLRARVDELAAQQKKAKPAPALVVQKEETYNDQLGQQIELTRDYHHSLGSRQDIALDLDPDSPLPRRTAALRHAFLIAEKEATATPGNIGWDFLASRYRQILAFHEDYNTAPDKGQENLEQLKEELNQAKKRINNLERFKTMYLELEERWDKCKDQAAEHYIELKSLAEQTGQKETFERVLDSYHTSYSDLGAMIQQGFNESIASTMADNPEDHLQEIRRLRTMAADQHKIITELQSKLQSAATKEEKEQVVEHLQTELQKQARFLQESETCIKLMEDELANSKQEMKQLVDRLGQLPQLKAELKELQSAAETHTQVVDSLKQENRRLAKKLKLVQEAPPEDSQEARTLRKELTTLQGKYNDLEEKFLNLKLKE